jgi:flagellin
LGATSALTGGQTISITNGQGTMNWTAGPTTYTGGNALASYATALSSASTLTIANNKGTVSFTEGSTDGTTVGGLINFINQQGAQYGISAALNSSSNLVITGTTAGGELLLSGTEFGTSSTDLGTMTAGAGSTVANLETAINGSGLGLSASLVNGNVEIASSQAGGAITGVTNTISALGTVAATSTVQDLMNWINGGNAGTGVTAGLSTVGSASELVITDTQNRNDLTVTSYDTALGATGGATPTNAFAAPTMSGAGSVSVFISDGATNSTFNTIGVAIGPLSDTAIGSNSPNLSSQNLQTSPSSALVVINGAISDVAEMRGVIGAGINRLSSATNVINTQIQNLTSAQSSIQDANIGQVVSNLSKYQVLEQTGIASLAQANSQEQAVLKLL